MESNLCHQRRVKIKTNLYWLIILTLLIATLSACDEEGSLESMSLTQKPNQEMSGKVLSLNRGELWRMDLSSRQFEKIPNTNWGESDDYPDAAQFLYSPSAYDAEESILQVRNCVRRDSNIICIVILDKNAIKVNSFSLAGSISGRARMSRDREYIALAIQYGISITNDTYLGIYTRDGDLVEESFISSGLTRVTLDWLPDGRLVYADQRGDERSIYFTFPNSTETERKLTLPENLKGSIGKFAVSPDGKQIALDLVLSSGFATTVATPWVVNIDGTNFRQLAIDPHADGEKDTYIKNPKWSPDGQWILVKYGGANGGSIGSISPLGYLFAVPSDGVRVPLSPSSYNASIETTAVQIKSNWYAVFYDSPGSTHNRDRWPHIDYDLILQE